MVEADVVAHRPHDSGAVSGLVGEREIRDLPLNGRSFQQLALLQPGVQAALAAGNDVVGGRTPKISINGARPEQNNFLLDGTDINNVYNKTPGSAAGVLLGVEAVLEFQVLTNAYSAEFGRSAGGVINAVTRSGTNALHGSAFEFHRNSALDARNFFDPASQPKPDFKRHQFGAVLGGPMRKDRTFFFAAYEGLIERLGRHRRHRGARRQRAPRDAAGRPGDPLHPAIPAVPRPALPARQRPVARRRRRGVPLLRHAADRRALRPGPRRSPVLGAATTCSCATPTIAATWTAFPPTSRRSRTSPRSTRNTYVTARAPACVLVERAQHAARRAEPLGVAGRQPAARSTSRRRCRGFPATRSGTSRSAAWSPRWRATSACRATTG